ncbi:GNAT family N-acetyltransferase [Pseudomonas atagonensis]|uniref:GNAT family N-acetyltransferase n=1 Tax=Pseudomonas atagonensis TaxID=2609964 RepID=UPI00140BEF2E|nr:GNAT family N-acetyltransferase [Pseudomonas atagonensis]
MPDTASRLTYRRPQHTDLAVVFAIFGDPQTNLFNPSGPMTDIAQAESLLGRWLQHWATHGYGWWAISSAQTPDKVIGFAGVAAHDYLGKPVINLGYRFAVKAWGRGYATEAARAALTHAFDHLGLPEVFGLVRPDHEASIRVLEKIGMRRFGELDDVPGKAPSLVFRVQRAK